MVNEIKELIVDYAALQFNFYKHLESEGFKHPINFSNTQVKHIMIPGEKRNIFYPYLDEYLGYLNDYILEFYLLEEKYQHLDFRVRTKEKKSITSKLATYDSRSENGSFPLQKCLNDLCGSRVILNEEVYTSHEFLTMCEDLKKKKIIFRHYERVDDDYKGYHLYLKNKSNLFFPWELQLWYNKNEQLNIAAHEKHKQAYIRS